MTLKQINGASISKIQLVDTSTGSLKDSDSADIKCDAYLEVVDKDGNTFYLPLYDTKN